MLSVEIGYSVGAGIEHCQPVEHWLVSHTPAKVLDGWSREVLEGPAWEYRVRLM